MKRLPILLLTALVVVFSACKGKKQANSDIIKIDYEAPKPSGPIAMNTDVQSTEVEWAEGRHYTVKVSRIAVDSLPMVSNDLEQKFIDNAIKLEVRRADSTLFFNRTLTKQAFVKWLDNDYRKKAILAGASFQKAEENNLLFVAWLNYPELGDDEAVDMQLSINRQGELSIAPLTEDEREDLMLQDQEL